MADLAVQLERVGNDCLDHYTDDKFVMIRTSVQNWRNLSALIDCYLGAK